MQVYKETIGTLTKMCPEEDQKSGGNPNDSIDNGTELEVTFPPSSWYAKAEPLDSEGCILLNEMKKVRMYHGKFPDHLHAQDMHQLCEFMKERIKSGSSGGGVFIVKSSKKVNFAVAPYDYQVPS